MEGCYASREHDTDHRPDHIGPSTAGDGSRADPVAQQRTDWRRCAQKDTIRGRVPPPHSPLQAALPPPCPASPLEPERNAFKCMAAKAPLFI